MTAVPLTWKQHLLAGGLSRGAAVTSMFPVDTVKTRVRPGLTSCRFASMHKCICTALYTLFAPQRGAVKFDALCFPINPVASGGHCKPTRRDQASLLRWIQCGHHEPDPCKRLAPPVCVCEKQFPPSQIQEERFLARSHFLMNAPFLCVRLCIWSSLQHAQTLVE